MNTLKLIFAAILVLGFISFIIWSGIQIFKHEGPDESSSRVRYDQTAKLKFNNEKLSA